MNRLFKLGPGTNISLLTLSLGMLGYSPAVLAAPPDEKAPSDGEAAAPTPVEPEPRATDAAAELPAVDGAAFAEPPREEEDAPEAYGMPEGDVELAASKHPVDYEKIVFEPGKGLAFKSEDERFGLKIRLRAQMLGSIEHNEDAPRPTELSFQIRRARLQFLGNFFGKHNKLKFELAIAPRDIGLDRGDGTISRSPLLDWYFEFDRFKSATLRIGQSKIPFSRQRVISSGNLQLVDRSIANREFTLDRDVGVELRSKDFLGLGWLRYYAGIYTGEGHSSFEFNDLGFNYLGRVEFLPMGQFKDYDESDHNRLKKARMSIGLSYAFVDQAKRSRNTTGSRPEDGGTYDYHNAEADIMFKLYGWSLFAEGFYRTGTRNPGPVMDENGDPILNDDGDPISVTDAANGFGYMAQTGFLVPKTKLELAARFAQVHGLGDDTALSRKDEVGGGLSYYFARHPFKLQADYFRLYDDGDIRIGNHVVRVQLQGAF
jgi:hypothetical protein